MNYFTELQERIREIRLSERFFYQMIQIYIFESEMYKDIKVYVSFLPTMVSEIVGRIMAGKGQSEGKMNKDTGVKGAENSG